MHDYGLVLIRAAAAMLVLLLITKMLGKSTISNMTFHDFVTGITLGSVAANFAFNMRLQSMFFMLSFVVIAAVSYLFSVMALKNRRIRKWVSGTPTLLIEGGNILEDNMRKVRFTLDSLNQALRAKGIFNIDEVEHAVLENNGTVSVLQKDEHQCVTKKDLKLGASSLSFPVELIMDGAVIDNSLASHGLTREWLEYELSRRGKRISDVFYGVRGTHRQLFFDYYAEHVLQPIDEPTETDADRG